MSVWLALAIATLPALLAFVANLVVNAKTLKRSQPKSEAETIDIGIGTQNKVMAGLSEQVARDEARIKSLEDKLARLEQRLSDSETEATRLRVQNAEYQEIIAGLRSRLDTLESELQDAHEQSDLLERQLKETNEQVKVLREQRKILIAHIERVEEWHRSGQTGAFPQLQNFDA